MSHVGGPWALKVGELYISPPKRRILIQYRNTAQSTNSSETDAEGFEAEILDIAATVVDLKLAFNVPANKL